MATPPFLSTDPRDEAYVKRLVDKFDSATRFIQHSISHLDDLRARGRTRELDQTIERICVNVLSIAPTIEEISGVKSSSLFGELALKLYQQAATCSNVARANSLSGSHIGLERPPELEMPIPSIATFSRGVEHYIDAYRSALEVMQYQDSPRRHPNPDYLRWFLGFGRLLYVLGASKCANVTALPRDPLPTNFRATPEIALYQGAIDHTLGQVTAVSLYSEPYAITLSNFADSVYKFSKHLDLAFGKLTQNSRFTQNNNTAEILQLCHAATRKVLSNA